MRSIWLHLLEKSFLENFIFCSLLVAVGEKITVALSPEHFQRKSTKLSITLKHIQFKVNSYIKRDKNTPWIIKNIYYRNNEDLFIKDLQSFPKKLKPEVSEHCAYLTAPIFTLFFFYIVNYFAHHYGHTQIACVQNTDPNPGILCCWFRYIIHENWNILLCPGVPLCPRLP